MKKKRVLVVGDANIDLLVKLPHEDAAGKRIFPAPKVCGGGSAANTAHALAKLGLAVDFMGTVGADAFGKEVMKEMEAAGIGTETLQQDAALNTVCVFAFIDERGERSLWPWPREAQSFRHLDEKRIRWDAMKELAWVHVSGMVFSNGYPAGKTATEVLRRAAEEGVPTSFDLNIRTENDGMNEENRRAILQAIQHCRYVLGSAEEEFAYLRNGSKAEDALAEARSFVTEKCSVIARQAALGSTAFDATGMFQASSFPTVTVDSIGAGDAYNGGFIAACLERLPLQEALRWGNAAGSYAVSHSGARNTPSLEELRAMLS